MANNSAWRAILLGGGTAGTIDLLFASIKKISNGGSPLDPWKGVASGLLGRAAREGGGGGGGGGAGMAVLGVALHFFIAIGAAALLYLIVRRVPWLARRWLVLGVVYGLAFL